MQSMASPSTSSSAMLGRSCPQQRGLQRPALLLCSSRPSSIIRKPSPLLHPSQVPSPQRGTADDGQQQQQQHVACRGANDYNPYPSAPEMPMPPAERMGEAARKALTRATRAVKRYGWISFWVQLTLSVVSGVILLFSVAFTSQSGPRASLYLTLVGILAGFLSTFWNFGYTRTGIRMQEYLDAGPTDAVPKIKKQQVIDMVTRGALINLVGLGSTLLGVQALVGILVAKTLSNASANPFIASANASYNPVLALDVFLVQAATNTLLGHFFSLCFSLFLLNIVGEGRGLRFQTAKERQETAAGQLIEGTVRGNAGTYRVGY